MVRLKEVEEEKKVGDHPKTKKKVSRKKKSTTTQTKQAIRCNIRSVKRVESTETNLQCRWTALTIVIRRRCPSRAAICRLRRMSWCFIWWGVGAWVNARQLLSSSSPRAHRIPAGSKSTLERSVLSRTMRNVPTSAGCTASCGTSWCGSKRCTTPSISPEPDPTCSHSKAR